MLFSWGQAAERMYFVVDGRLEYTWGHDERDKSRHSAEERERSTRRRRSVSAKEMLEQLRKPISKDRFSEIGKGGRNSQSSDDIDAQFFSRSSRRMTRALTSRRRSVECAHDEVREPEAVARGQWVSEAAVWIRWFYPGNMMGKENSFLMSVSVDVLHSTMQQYVDTMPHCFKYARLFVELAQSEDRAISDIWGSFDQLQVLAQRAFSEEEFLEEELTIERRSSISSSGSLFSLTGAGGFFHSARRIFGSRTSS